MKKLALLVVTLAGVAGCRTSGPEERWREVIFTEGESPDTTDFLRHWTRGTKSAWYSRDGVAVLVVDSADGSAVRISGFPSGHGHVVATGWENEREFFVHLSPGADTGTMVYIDLEAKKVIRIAPWGAW